MNINTSKWFYFYKKINILFKVIYFQNVLLFSVLWLELFYYLILILYSINGFKNILLKSITFDCTYIYIYILYVKTKENLQIALNQYYIQVILLQK